MGFLMFWSLCGLIAFLIHLTVSWYSGQNVTITELIAGIVGYTIAGALGFTALILLTCDTIQNMEDKVIIKGRKQ